MNDDFNFDSLAKRSSTRRDFLKISGLSASTLALGPIINVPLVYAKAEGLYPSKPIQYIIPNKPGGGYDIIGRSMGPYITKYLRSFTPGATGGDIVVRNEERKGYQILFSAKPDGYSIGMMDTSPYIDTLLGAAEVDFTKYTFLQLVVSTTKLITANKKVVSATTSLTLFCAMTS